MLHWLAQSPVCGSIFSTDVFFFPDDSIFSQADIKLATSQTVQDASNNWYLIQNIRKIVALPFKSISPK